MTRISTRHLYVYSCQFRMLLFWNLLFQTLARSCAFPWRVLATGVQRSEFLKFTAKKITNFNRCLNPSLNECVHTTGDFFSLNLSNKVFDWVARRCNFRTTGCPVLAWIFINVQPTRCPGDRSLQTDTGTMVRPLMFPTNCVRHLGLGLVLRRHVQCQVRLLALSAFKFKLHFLWHRC